eukprot:m51a1_g2406 hypothetical protein (206) ;mRNA; r:773132-773970
MSSDAESERNTSRRDSIWSDAGAADDMPFARHRRAMEGAVLSSHHHLARAQEAICVEEERWKEQAETEKRLLSRFKCLVELLRAENSASREERLEGLGEVASALRQRIDALATRQWSFPSKKDRVVDPDRALRPGRHFREEMEEAREYDPLEETLEKIVAQQLEEPGAYVFVGSNTWPGFIELLRNADIIDTRPDNYYYVRAKYF